MLATRLQKIKIIIVSIWTLFFNSILVLFYSFLFKGIQLRHKVDKINQSWSRGVLKAAKIKFDVYDEQKVNFLPHRSYIIMSNHASQYDIPLIIASFPQVSLRMIAKKELFRIPVWGHAMRNAEYIAIDRNNRLQAAKDIRSAKEKMESGIVIWVAPEGTRTRTGELGKFKKGGFLLAFQTNAIIIPVGLVGTRKILPPDTLNFNLNEEVEIHIGRHVDTKEFTIRDIQKVIKAVESEISRLIAYES